MLIDKAKTYKRAVARRYLPVSSEEIVSKVREADKYYLSTKFDGKKNKEIAKEMEKE